MRICRCREVGPCAVGRFETRTWKRPMLFEIVLPSRVIAMSCCGAAGGSLLSLGSGFGVGVGCSGPGATGGAVDAWGVGSVEGWPASGEDVAGASWAGCG